MSGIIARGGLQVNAAPVIVTTARRELRDGDDGVLSGLNYDGVSDLAVNENESPVSSDICDDETSIVSIATQSSVLS